MADLMAAEYGVHQHDFQLRLWVCACVCLFVSSIYAEKGLSYSTNIEATDRLLNWIQRETLNVQNDRHQSCTHCSGSVLNFWFSCKLTRQKKIDCTAAGFHSRHGNIRQNWREREIHHFYEHVAINPRRPCLSLILAWIGESVHRPPSLGESALAHTVHSDLEFPMQRHTQPGVVHIARLPIATSIRESPSIRPPAACNYRRR